jgi:hypothetical protein
MTEFLKVIEELEIKLEIAEESMEMYKKEIP